MKPETKERKLREARINAENQSMREQMMRMWQKIAELETQLETVYQGAVRVAGRALSYEEYKQWLDTGDIPIFGKEEQNGQSTDVD